MSFGELDAWSGRVAGALAALGVEAGDRVAVAHPRGTAAVAAMLGIMKLRATTVPVDPTWPVGRQQLIIDDSKPKVIVGAGPRDDGALWVDAGSLRSSGPAAPQPVAGEETDLLSLLYTSGSTGRPKGVEIEHSGTMAWLEWGWEAWPFQPGERMLWRSSLNFVDTALELWGSLLVGVPVEILPPSDAARPLEILRLVNERQVTRVNLVPSVVRALIDIAPVLTLPKGSIWSVSGEATTLPLLKALRAAAPDLVVLNLYGLTEVCNVTCAAFVPEDLLPNEHVPIGFETCGAHLVILNAEREAVPDGNSGEIWIGGPTLARGYYQRPEEEGRFWNSPQWGRLYRTGDLGWRTPQGEFFCAGRVDHQVKLRGVRIEPAEVERVLLEAGARQASVVLAADPPRLVGFVTPQDVDLAGLRAAANRNLPEAWRPSHVQALAALPLTPNGKVDRLALRALAGSVHRVGTPPETPSERLLARIWSRAMGEQELVREHTLAELGADSLARLAVSEALAEAGFSWDPEALASCTLAELARHMDEASAPVATSASVARVRQLEPGDLAELLPRVVKTMLQRNPAVMALRPTEEEVGRYPKALMPVALEDGVSAIALDPRGQVVGYSIAIDASRDDLCELPEVLRPEWDICIALENPWMAEHVSGPGQAVYLSIGGVDSGEDGLALSQAMDRLILEAAKARGYRWALTTTTHAVSAWVAERLGFTKISELAYGSFRTADGKAVYEHLQATHGGVRLYAMRIDGDTHH